jgi:hypothetical protein
MIGLEVMSVGDNRRSHLGGSTYSTTSTSRSALQLDKSMKTGARQKGFFYISESDVRISEGVY